MPKGKRRKTKNLFLMGLAALLPTIITILILVVAFNFLNDNIANPIGRGVLKLLGLILGDNVAFLEGKPWLASVIGFPITIIVVFVVGYLAASWLGKKVFKMIETWVLNRFPVIRSIYPYAKQFSDLFLSEDKKVAFQKVVAVEYPRQGLYSLAFVTSEGMKDLNKATGKTSITVFIPSSPTPITGYTIFVPREDIIELSISVDEAIRLSISAGVLIPPHQLTNLQESPASSSGGSAVKESPTLL